MKILKIFVLALSILAAVTTANAQISDVPRKHNYSVGPIAGYNLDTEGLTYGAGLMYEFRPFQRIGFTAGLTYERTRSDVDHYYGEINGIPLRADVRIHQLYSLQVGARYYLDRFYLGGTLGVGYDDGGFKLSNGDTADGGHEYNLYISVGAGYQLPLKNGHALEFEAGYFGTKFMNLGGAIRYKFGK